MPAPKKAAAPAPWKMPKWMEPYRPLFQNTGGNSVEELMNNHTADMFNNCILAALCIAGKSQVALLEQMHAKGMLP